MATNTINGANLAAVAEMSLPALDQMFAPLRAFTTDFSADIAAKGESVVTRYPNRVTAVDLSSGYTSQNTRSDAVTVTLNSFFGFPYGFFDVERSKSAIDLNRLFVEPAIAAVGKKVFQDIWGLITDANYPAATQSELLVTAANFDRDDVADLAAQLTDNGVPPTGRSLILNPAYYAALAKDLNSVDIAGQSRTLGENIIPRLHGFDVYQTPYVTANAANVTGFACHSSAIAIAARGVDAPALGNMEVENVIVPDLGLPVQFRRWYDERGGELVYSMGVLYGFANASDASGTPDKRMPGIKIVSAA
ncbi:MAG: Verrucomicrobia phage [Verrucomicrobiota bacterium]|jgi:hypothetical protein